MGLDFEFCSSACKDDLTEVGGRNASQGRGGTGLPRPDSLQWRLTLAPSGLPACLPAGGVALRTVRQPIYGALADFWQ
jgi:hypothetical protein